MKKEILRSFWIKLLAFILCLSSVGTAAALVVKFNAEDSGEGTYYLGAEFRNTYRITHPLDCVLWAFEDFSNTEKFETSTESSNDGVVPPVVELTEEPYRVYPLGETQAVTVLPTAEPVFTKNPQDFTLDEWIASMDRTYWKENEIAGNKEELLRVLSRYPVEYYMEIDGEVVTNTVGKDVNYFSMASYGVECRTDGDYFAAKLYDNYVASLEREWRADKARVESTVVYGSICILLFFIGFIYLLVMCGRAAEDDDIHMLFIDRIPVEITFAGMFGIGLFGLIAYGTMISAPFNSVITAFISAFAMAVAAVVIILALSLTRNLKNHTFLKRTIVGYIHSHSKAKKGEEEGENVLEKAKNKYLHRISGKEGRYTLLAVLGYSLLLIFLTEWWRRSIFAFLLLIAVPFVAVYYVALAVKAIISIRQGILEIKNGNTEYKIEESFPGVFGEAANAVNHIGEGLTHAVQEEIKATRMKSELITNVSHDLKTPLTSIVNYADLLCEERLEPEEANDYAAIIKKKAERLVNLTADLFDISKVESGNETIKKEELDLTLLIRQALAELDQEIEASALTFQTELEEASVLGDGKKLSRVFENLFVNALKYSMEHTRVFVTMKKDGENIHIEIKNISATPLLFDDEEITERFVRGDESRSSEGSGLGLAIAKSYTEACGGTFRIVTDGDLFKACLSFKTI